MRRGLALLLFGFMAAALFVSGLADSSSSSSSSEDEDEGSEEEGNGYAAERIDSSSVRLERLEARLNAIKDRLEDSQSVETLDHALELKARLRNIEGDGCAEGEFACGDNARKCISSKLCCDGYNDCPGDQDESDDVCKARAKAGSTFSGHIHWSGCKSDRDSDFSISITDSTKYDYFPSRLFIAARTVYGDDNEEHAFDSNGYYDFGQKTFSLNSQEHVSSKCVFISDDVVDCKITGEGDSLCANVRLSRD